MGIVQNGYDQYGNAQDDLEFLICTHKAPPLSARLGTGGSTSPGCPVKYIMFSKCGELALAIFAN